MGLEECERGRDPYSRASLRLRCFVVIDVGFCGFVHFGPIYKLAKILEASQGNDQQDYVAHADSAHGLRDEFQSRSQIRGIAMRDKQSHQDDDIEPYETIARL